MNDASQKRLEIEYISIDKLKPFVGNPRYHSDRNIDDIRKSLSRFSWTNPILARKSDNMIIAGHGRLEAARQEGIDIVPVIFLDFSENDAKLYSITDNRTSETSEWNVSELNDLIKVLEVTNADIDVTGFDFKELDQLMMRQSSVQGENPSAEDLWQDMPEFEQEDQRGVQLVVWFDSMEDKIAFGALIGQEITEKTKGIRHPKKDRENIKAWAYEQDESETGS